MCGIIGYVGKNDRDAVPILMDGLKRHPRPVKGRCAECQHFALCGGNTRVRAHQLTGDYWAEDPGCYLDDDEIGLSPEAASRLARVALTPFSGKRRIIEVLSA